VFPPGQSSENKKQNEEDADDMDGFDADEEDEEVDSDKEMGLDDEDGDEVSSLQLQKLAAEVCFSICTYPVPIIYRSNSYLLLVQVLFSFVFQTVQLQLCSETIGIVLKDAFSNPDARLFIFVMIQARGFQPADEDDDSDDGFSDDEELQSPIDEVDPFIFFVETVQGKL
jgi:hypothetical protein